MLSPRRCLSSEVCLLSASAAVGMRQQVRALPAAVCRWQRSLATDPHTLGSSCPAQHTQICLAGVCNGRFVAVEMAMAVKMITARWLLPRIYTLRLAPAKPGVGPPAIAMCCDCSVCNGNASVASASSARTAPAARGVGSVVPAPDFVRSTKCTTAAPISACPATASFSPLQTEPACTTGCCRRSGSPWLAAGHQNTV